MASIGRDHVVHDPHHHRPHRRVGGLEHLPRAVAFIEADHVLAGAGVDGIEGDEVVAVLLLHHEQALAFEKLVLDRAVDLADDAAEDHWMFTPSTMAMMAWSTGTNV